MTAEELMKPRFEVIADYPSAKFKIGYILNANTPHLIAFYSKYPHLFRRLNWWEHRKLEDLPKKMESIITEEIFEISSWTYDHYLIGWCREYGNGRINLSAFNECNYIPID